MSADASSHEAALEAADQMRRYNVWRGVYESAVAGALNLDGLQSNSVDGGVIIQLPDLMYPSVSLLSVEGDEGEGNKLFVTEREIRANPWPNSTDEALMGRTYILHESGVAPRTAITWHAVSGKRHLLLNELSAEAYQTTPGELEHLDIVFGEIDDARRIHFAKRAGHMMTNERRVTLGERVGNLLKKNTR